MGNKKNNESGKENKYFGKYRGTVTQVDNSGGMWKVKANIPKLLNGYTTGWALPCLGFAFDGIQIGFKIAKGDMVWIEFEQGNIDLPIWTGGWFNKGQAPTFTGIMINGTLAEFKDDSVEIHGDLTVDGKVLCGDLEASSKEEGGGTILSSGTATFGGAVTAKKTIKATGEITSGTVKLTDHVHKDVTTGTDKTGKPE